MAGYEDGDESAFQDVTGTEDASVTERGAYLEAEAGGRREAEGQRASRGGAARTQVGSGNFPGQQCGGPAVVSRNQSR